MSKAGSPTPIASSSHPLLAGSMSTAAAPVSNLPGVFAKLPDKVTAGGLPRDAFSPSAWAAKVGNAPLLSETKITLSKLQTRRKKVSGFGRVTETLKR